MTMMTGTDDEPRARANALAFAEWRALLGPDHVLDPIAAGARYAVDTSRYARPLGGALRVRTRAELPAVLAVATRHRLPLYPISRGHNWGYGTSNPSRDGAVILDLGGLDRIVALDADAGTVTLEPGVTQRQLAEYLERRSLPFMVPVTGAGPDGSLLGNALERGYGITPLQDHFGAMRALRAVLPDGSEYVGALRELGSEAAEAFKWGIGPYLDGLFAQGGFGVVTEMTLALARRPESLTAFFFWIDDDEALEAAVEAVREALRTVGGSLGGINLMNSVRLLAMESPYPFSTVDPERALTHGQLRDLARDIGVAAWMGAGAIYGPREVTRAVKQVVKRILKPLADRMVFFDRSLVTRVGRVASLVPGNLLRGVRATVERMSAGIKLLDGYPSTMALPLAYWKRPGAVPRADHDPARDGCGLLWYSPLVPMKPGRIRSFVTLARRVMAEHQFEPLITLTSLSEALFDSTMPILFDGRDAAATRRAEACYRALFAAGRAEGFVPYRVPVQLMDLVVDGARPSWQLVDRLKRAVDPAGIVAPGRYAPVSSDGAGASEG
jgi:4-cresol dehydrogenase (hydroxylating)